MSVVVGTAAVAVALARNSLIGRIRRAGGILPRLGGALLLVAGRYVAWYGAWELRVLHAGAGTDPVIDAAGHVQQWLAGNAQALGALGFFVVLAILLLSQQCRDGGRGWISLTPDHVRERDETRQGKHQ